MPKSLKKKSLLLTINPVVVNTDPETTVYNLILDDGKTTWNETFGTREMTRAYLRGLQAMAIYAGLGCINVPDVPRRSSRPITQNLLSPTGSLF